MDTPGCSLRSPFSLSARQTGATAHGNHGGAEETTLLREKVRCTSAKAPFVPHRHTHVESLAENHRHRLRHFSLSPDQPRATRGCLRQKNLKCFFPWACSRDAEKVRASSPSSFGLATPSTCQLSIFASRCSEPVGWKCGYVQPVCVHPGSCGRIHCCPKSVSVFLTTSRPCSSQAARRSTRERSLCASRHLRYTGRAEA